MAVKERRPNVPKGLSGQSERVWLEITGSYTLSPDGMLFLKGGLREWDRYRETNLPSAFRNFMAAFRHLQLSAPEEM
jgi:hypothetical protein